MAGLFITFEGGEGGGKSTQVALLAERLRETGLEVCTTREPGGTEMAERIRALLVTGETDALSSTAEALLNYAARDDHLRRVIRPALERGAVVISDRFMDSTRAYQGYAGDCPLSLIEALERDVVGETVPDKTIILDIDPEEGLRRVGVRGLEKMPFFQEIKEFVNIREASFRIVHKLNEMDASIESADFFRTVYDSCKKSMTDSSIERKKECLAMAKKFVRQIVESHRFEGRPISFHKKVQEAFLRIARENPERCVVIDAARPVDVVAADVWRAVAPLLKKAQA